jgi:DNA-binding transcriptional MerR regulator
MIRWVAEPTFTIGEAARRAGVSADTVRYYERRGVLPTALRTSNGYRRYADDSVQRILFVRNALRVGFTLREIAAFLRARESGRPPCRDVRAAAGRLVEDMDRRIAEMVSSRAAIVAMLAEWDQRLARTPAGTPARLLDTTAPTSVSRTLRPSSVRGRSTPARSVHSGSRR